MLCLTNESYTIFHILNWKNKTTNLYIQKNTTETRTGDDIETHYSIFVSLIQQEDKKTQPGSAQFLWTTERHYLLFYLWYKCREAGWDSTSSSIPTSTEATFTYWKKWTDHSQASSLTVESLPSIVLFCCPHSCVYLHALNNRAS